MRLNELRDNAGAVRNRKRVGRGIGSGTGKTAGRGHKGQKSRSGVAIKGFEGGQMPLHRRLPKRGFTPLSSKDYNEINLDRVQRAIDAGALDAGKPVTVAALLEAGVIRRPKDGVRLLGKGELKAKVTFEVTGVSAGAAKAVEAAGGSVTVVPMARTAPASAKPAAGEAEGEAKAKAAAKTAKPKAKPAKEKTKPAKRPAKKDS